MLRSFDLMLDAAKKQPEEMPLPPPDEYTVDAIVFQILMMEMAR